MAAEVLYAVKKSEQVSINLPPAFVNAASETMSAIESGKQSIGSRTQTEISESHGLGTAAAVTASASATIPTTQAQDSA